MTILAAVAAAALLGVLSTIADWIWAAWSLPHKAIYGLVHGAVLLSAVGLALGVRAKRAAAGFAGGLAAGFAAAASFYALAPLLRFSAMFVSWMLLWLAFAALDAWLHGRRPLGRDAWIRGGIAAVASGAAFYAISGIWMRPGPPDYAWNLVAWTFAYLPGFLALFVGARSDVGPR